MLWFHEPPCPRAEGEMAKRLEPPKPKPVPDWFRRSMECWCGGGVLSPHPIGTEGCRAANAPFASSPSGYLTDQDLDSVGTLASYGWEDAIERVMGR